MTAGDMLVPKRPPTAPVSSPDVASEITVLTLATEQLQDGALRRPSLKDQVLELIRQALVAGQLRPGEIYSASATATRLGTSNGPVREAMLSLVDEGIMEVIPNRGFRVVPMTEHDLDEVFELRMMIEVPAMGRLAREGLGTETEQQARDLAEQCSAWAHDGDVARFLATDRELHLSLTGLLGNARMVRTVAQLRDQTRLYGLAALAQAHQLDTAAAEHHVLLDAVAAGDVETAELLMTAHLAHVRSDWAAPRGAAEPSDTPRKGVAS